MPSKEFELITSSGRLLLAMGKSVNVGQFGTNVNLISHAVASAPTGSPAVNNHRATAAHWLLFEIVLIKSGRAN